MPATMQDVARKAGVSKTTVSRVINGVPNSASSQTVDRILEAVEELGYAPNIIDASLKRLGLDTIDLYYQHRVEPEAAIDADNRAHCGGHREPILRVHYQGS